MPFFSLILPCYKVVACVERCVRSILVQDFTDYEIILVDDGSPDATPDLCDQLAAEYPCIRVIHKENGGLASARNAGMEAARGCYIWFVDADDWIEPGSLALLHQACADGSPEIVKFSHFRVTDKTSLVQHNVEPGIYAGEERCSLMRCKALREAGKYSLSACFHVYQRAFLEKSGVHFVSERIVGSEDYLFNLQLLLQAACIRVLSEAFYSYELRQGSLTQSYKPDLPERYGELHRQLTRYASEHAASGYQPLIDRFYLWHLVVSTCFSQEYLLVTQTHPLALARQNVRRILRSQQVQRAAKNGDHTGMRWQKKLQLAAIQLRMESLFFFLYVKKSGARGIK